MQNDDFITRSDNMSNENKIKGHKMSDKQKPKTIEDLVKGGFKKGEFVNLFSYTGKGTTIINTNHPNVKR